MAGDEELLDSLFALYAEEDRHRRSELLDSIIAEDIEFHGLQGYASGRGAFDARFRDGGTRLVRTTSVDRHGEWLRSGWELRAVDGAVPTAPDGRPYSGLQLTEVTPDGRIRKIVPFLGLTPPESGES